MPPELASSLASQVARGEVLQWDAHQHPEQPTPDTSQHGGRWMEGPSGVGGGSFGGEWGMPRAAGMFGSSSSLRSLQEGPAGAPTGAPAGVPPRPPYVPPPPLPVRMGSSPYARMGMMGSAAGAGSAHYPLVPSLSSRGPSAGGSSDVSLSPSPATATMAGELRGTPPAGERPALRDRRTHGGDGRVFRILSAGNLQTLAGESIDE